MNGNKYIGIRPNRQLADETTDRGIGAKRIKTQPFTKETDNVFGPNTIRTQQASFFSKDGPKWEDYKLSRVFDGKKTLKVNEAPLEKATKWIQIDQGLIKKSGNSAENPSKNSSPSIKLIDYQIEVIKNMIDRSVGYKLNNYLKDKYEPMKKACRLIDAFCTSYKLRPETQVLALYVINAICSEVDRKTVVDYVIPSLLIATKIEEYYPPTIQELIRSLRYYENSHLPLSQESIIENEGKILLKLNHLTICPPVLDMANIIMNETGYEVNQKVLRSIMFKILSFPNIFSRSLLVIVLACLSLSVDIENRNCSVKLMQEAKEFLEKEFRVVVEKDEVQSLCLDYFSSQS